MTLYTFITPTLYTFIVLDTLVNKVHFILSIFIIFLNIKIQLICGGSLYTLWFTVDLPPGSVCT